MLSLRVLVSLHMISIEYNHCLFFLFLTKMNCCSLIDEDTEEQDGIVTSDNANWWPGLWMLIFYHQLFYFKSFQVQTFKRIQSYGHCMSCRFTWLLALWDICIIHFIKFWITYIGFLKKQWCFSFMSQLPSYSQET